MTVIKHSEQRVGVFIDTQNLYHSAKNLYNGARVNFGAIMKEVVANRALIRAIAYVISTESGEEKSFFEALEKLGIEAKTKNIQIFNSGAKKADWDVGLAVDAIKMAPKLDTIIIVSGDGDFVPLVEYLQVNEGCQVEVIAFGKSSSSMLRDIADDFIDMCQDPKKYVIQGATLVQRQGAAAVQRQGAGTIGYTPRPPQNRNSKKRLPAANKRMPAINPDRNHSFDDVAPEDLE
ncbi:MAG: hypothetical protein QG568_775 [Patescibacteria group bacterium]|nr:hypothetical protein [Patescibacteria group bacterium]